MPFNTFTVASAVTPSVIETYISHFWNRAPLRQKPTAHVSYHEGLALIRNFLEYASKHTVEDLQAFTQQWVPIPTWVRVDNVEIAKRFLDRSAEIIIRQLGPEGIKKVGGETWWQWRGPGSGRAMRAEWIEMKKDYQLRKRTGANGERIMLYVHGGAYYFGSVDEHRYQMQRHARKLRARLLAPRYRLAPQYPFPCGLQDNIAAYLYCLDIFEPGQILFAGDSAGGGMVLAMLVTLRDQGIPLPAGAILLSPWSDLTHSFPSVAGNGEGDYIPRNGLSLYKPSMAWPPPPADPHHKNQKRRSMSNALRAADENLQPTASRDTQESPSTLMPDHSGGRLANDAKSSLSPLHNSRSRSPGPPTDDPIARPGFGPNLRVELDGNVVEILDQIQLYTTNQLITHPLVSPVLQPSLGGLPPLLIQVGGAELLRDEQLYIAHKAANPQAYLPSDAIRKEHDPRGYAVHKWPPTDVQLQLWDDLCHVPHTLSFTRPAKYMYRGVAQFGAWALARRKGLAADDPIDDDDESIISCGEEHEEAFASVDQAQQDISLASHEVAQMQSFDSGNKGIAVTEPSQNKESVGKAGDPLPHFKDHMIRQRVSRHGIISPLEPAADIPALHMAASDIGVLKPTPVRKYLNAKKILATKFAKDMRKLQKQREKDMAKGYEEFPGEKPPPTALASRRRKGMDDGRKKSGKSWGLAMWTGWGSKHDEETVERGEARKAKEQSLSRQGSASVPEEPGASGYEAHSLQQARSNSLVSSGRSVGHQDSKVNKDDRSRPDSSRSQVRKPSSLSTAQAGRPQTSREHLASPSLTALPIAPPRVEGASGGHVNVRPASFSAASSTSEGARPHERENEASDSNHLSSNSNRPNGGAVAYPFKLRNAVWNPSTASLATQAADGTLSREAISGSTEHPTTVKHDRNSRGTRTGTRPMSNGKEMASNGFRGQMNKSTSSPQSRADTTHDDMAGQATMGGDATLNVATPTRRRSFQMQGGPQQPSTKGVHRDIGTRETSEDKRDSRPPTPPAKEGVTTSNRTQPQSKRFSRLLMGAPGYEGGQMAESRMEVGTGSRIPSEQWGSGKENAGM